MTKRLNLFFLIISVVGLGLLSPVQHKSFASSTWKPAYSDMLGKPYNTRL